MSSGGFERLTDQQVEDFAMKLSDFAGQLTPQERNFLGDILAHAANVGGESVGSQADDLTEFLLQINEAYGDEIGVGGPFGYIISP